MFVSLTPVFLGSLSCRPATISKFFGDQKPDCAGACDYCRDPKAVRAQLEKGATLCTKTGAARSTQPRGPFGFDRDLYARGRKGYGFERHDEEGWESGGDDDDGSEHRRKEFGDLFKKQMNLRKVKPRIHVQCTCTALLSYCYTQHLTHKRSIASVNKPSYTVAASSLSTSVFQLWSARQGGYGARGPCKAPCGKSLPYVESNQHNRAIQIHTINPDKQKTC
ncbi:unnamed protein product [Oncorhynchus mykiss]|uniref:ATP-dependent DNA helicase RecQ zinc-binding domain-containing protein n=1 Tax=Oncorhynchus mykiss TaxID=8022 RepID=A0A060XJ85_ONCMY|nr:unnamed protein product [Oncorhynchus mykiss]